MRSFMPSLFIAAAMAVPLAVVGTPTASAATVYWANQTAGNFLWTDANQWRDAAQGPGTVPVNGDTIKMENAYSLANCGIDVAGADLNLPTGIFAKPGNGGRQWTFYDSATLTANNNPLLNQTDFTPVTAGQTLVEAANASTKVLTLAQMTGGKGGNFYYYIPISVSGNMKFQEAGKEHYYGNVSAGGVLATGNVGWGTDVYFHGAINISGTFIQPYRSGTLGDGQQLYLEGGININTMEHQGGEIYIASTASGTYTNYNFKNGWLHNASNAINFGNMNWTGGTYYADANGAVASLGSNVTVPGGTGLVISVAQTTLPAMTTVNAYGSLSGDMTGADYEGDGKNVTLNENAIFSASAGPVPTRTELGSAILLQALTTANAGGPYEFGDNGVDSIYKGFALGSWTTNANISREFKSIGGDLNGYIDYSNITTNAAGIYRGDGTSTTANIQFSKTGYINLATDFNKNAITAGEPDLITTFNLIRAPGNERGLTLNFGTNGVKIQAGQTVYVENGRIGTWAGYQTPNNLTGGGLLGTLELKNGEFYGSADKFTAADTGILRFSGRTIVSLAAANVDGYEALADRLEYSGYPMINLSGNATYTFDWGPFGTMEYTAEFLRNCDYTRGNYQDTTFLSDLQIGHGRFLISVLDRANSNLFKTTNGSKIVYGGTAGGAAPWIGFAAVISNLAVAMEVNAPGAIVQAGTDDPTRIVHTLGTNGAFTTAIPDQTVQFQQTVTAAGVRILSGKAQFNQNLTTGTIQIGSGNYATQLIMAGGKTATATTSLSGTGNWTGGNGVTVASGAKLAPGNSIGMLNNGGGVLNMADGAIYEWQIGAPTGTAGTDWDLVKGSNITFAGDLVFSIDASLLVGSIAGTEEFIVASASGTMGALASYSFLGDWVGTLAVVDKDLILSNVAPNILAGDTNDDGVVDAADFINLKKNFGAGVDGGVGVGNFDGAGTVDWADLSTLMANVGATMPGPSASTPEPATLGLLAIGALAVIRRRRAA